MSDTRVSRDSPATGDQRLELKLGRITKNSVKWRSADF